jgi:hypothetical protein
VREPGSGRAGVGRTGPLSLLLQEGTTQGIDGPGSAGARHLDGSKLVAAASPMKGPGRLCRAAKRVCGEGPLRRDARCERCRGFFIRAPRGRRGFVSCLDDAALLHGTAYQRVASYLTRWLAANHSQCLA